MKSSVNLCFIIFGIIVILTLDSLSAIGQSGLDIRTYKFGISAFGFHGIPSKTRITTFGAEDEAKRVFQKIIGSQGLSSSIIEIRASGDIENAAAFIDKSGVRIIAYNVIFMENVKRKTGRYWSLISIMAHEVGHHLNFHTYERNTPAPKQSRKDELDADYFSGHALARLGASLSDAIAAMKAVSPMKETSTHPGLNTRLQAIALGWKAARNKTSMNRKPAPIGTSSSSSNPWARPKKKQEIFFAAIGVSRSRIISCVSRTSKQFILGQDYVLEAGEVGFGEITIKMNSSDPSLKEILLKCSSFHKN